LLVVLGASLVWDFIFVYDRISIDSESSKIEDPLGYLDYKADLEEPEIELPSPRDPTAAK
jgi:hypothetical protein